jgi:predicted DNA-binding transcriptional regulator AlpA
MQTGMADACLGNSFTDAAMLQHQRSTPMKINKHARTEQGHTNVNTLPATPLQLASAEWHRAIRLPEVLHMTGLSRSAWYALINPRLPSYDSQAPRPFKLGPSGRSPSAWWAWEVLAYLQAKSNARRVH